jgi:hypothetical protein
MRSYVFAEQSISREKWIAFSVLSPDTADRRTSDVVGSARLGGVSLALGRTRLVCYRIHFPEGVSFEIHLPKGYSGDIYTGCLGRGTNLFWIISDLTTI